jgi:predicted nucleic acid-binding Zn ribbon protein
MKHTPGILEFSRNINTGKPATLYFEYEDEEFDIATFDRWPIDPNDEMLANAERIVSCVNACAGINPEAIPELIKAAEKLINRVSYGKGHCIVCGIPVENNYMYCSSSCVDLDTEEQLKQALKKVKGEL